MTTDSLKDTVLCASLLDTASLLVNDACDGFSQQGFLSSQVDRGSLEAS